MLRILIPLDGSGAAEESLSHAIALSRTFPAEITLLRITAASELNLWSRASGTDLALWRHQAESYLASIRDRLFGDVSNVRCRVAEGFPAETIIDFVATGNTDLVVLSRYGRGNAQAFTLGGTVLKVLSRVACSVLLVDPNSQGTADMLYKRILVPIDNRRECECAIGVASMLAEINKGSLRILQVYQDPQLPSGVPESEQVQTLVREIQRLLHTAAERRLRELAAKQPFGTDVSTSTMPASDPAGAIEYSAAKQHSDLLVLYANNAESESRFDPVTQNLILHSPRTLLLLKGALGNGLTSNFRCVYLDESALKKAG